MKDQYKLVKPNYHRHSKALSSRISLVSVQTSNPIHGEQRWQNPGASRAAHCSRPRAQPLGRGGTSSFLPGALKAASFKEFQCVSLSLSSTSLSLATNKQLSGYLSWALIKRCQSLISLSPANQSEASTHAVPAFTQQGGGQRSAAYGQSFAISLCIVSRAAWLIKIKPSHNMTSVRGNALQIT